jgi:hypothetical protein
MLSACFVLDQVELSLTYPSGTVYPSERINGHEAILDKLMKATMDPDTRCEMLKCLVGEILPVEMSQETSTAVVTFIMTDRGGAAQTGEFVDEYVLKDNAWKIKHRIVRFHEKRGFALTYFW